MPDLIVTPNLLSALMAIEARRSEWVPRSWAMTICPTCLSDQCLRTPTESRDAITAWLCVRCGYFETGGRVGRDIVSLPTRL